MEAVTPRKSSSRTLHSLLKSLMSVHLCHANHASTCNTHPVLFPDVRVEQEGIQTPCNRPGNNVGLSEQCKYVQLAGINLQLGMNQSCIIWDSITETPLDE